MGTGPTPFSGRMKTMLTIPNPASGPPHLVGPPELLIAENDGLHAILRDIGAALVDPDEQDDLLGALAVEHGMDRAQEIMHALFPGRR